MNPSIFEDDDFRALPEADQVRFVAERDADFATLSPDEQVGFVRSRTGRAGPPTRTGGLKHAIAQAAPGPQGDQALSPDDWKAVEDTYDRFEGAAELPGGLNPVRGTRRFLQAVGGGVTRSSAETVYGNAAKGARLIDRLAGGDPAARELAEKLEGMEAGAHGTADAIFGEKPTDFAGDVTHRIAEAVPEIAGLIAPAAKLAGPTKAFAGLGMFDSAAEGGTPAEIGAAGLEGAGMGSVMHRVSQLLPRLQRIGALGTLFGGAGGIHGDDPIKAGIVGGALGIPGGRGPRYPLLRKDGRPIEVPAEPPPDLIRNDARANHPSPRVVESGRETSIPLSTGKELPARYEVVEARELVPSHDAGNFQPRADYPKGVQERTYHRTPEEQAKVVRIADTFDARQVYTDAPNAIDGPPVVAGNVVLGGNGRTMGMQRIAAGLGKTKPEALKQAALDAAEKFGVDRAVVEGMEVPVIVRRVQGNGGYTGAELSRLLNEDLKQTVGRTERGVSLSKSLSEQTLDTFGRAVEAAQDGATLNATITGSRDLVKSLEADGIITPQNRTQYVEKKTGLLNEDGRRLVEDVFLGKIVANADLVDAMPKGLRRKLVRSIPTIVKTEAVAGELGLARAIEDVARSEIARKASGDSLEQFFNQNSMDPLPSQSNPLLARVHRALVEGKPNEVRDAFGRLAAVAERATDPTPDMFGQKPTLESAWDVFAPQQEAAFRDLRRGEFQDAPGSTNTSFVKYDANIDPSAPLPRKIRKRGDILFRLARDLRVPIQQGSVRPRSGPKAKSLLGYYAPGRGTLRIRDWNDIQTAAHEVAHALQDRYPAIRKLHEIPAEVRDAIREREQAGEKITPAELERLAPEVAELDRISYDTSAPLEGFAEFHRLWLTDRPYVAKHAPLNLARWENEILPTLPARERRALQRAQKQMHEHLGAGAIAGLRERIGPPGSRQASEALEAAGDRFRQSYIDDTHGFELAERYVSGKIEPGGFTEAFRRLRGVSAMGEGLMRFGAPVWKEGGVGWEGRGIFDILAPVGRSKKDLDAFFDYAVARQARELMLQGREKLLTPEMIEAGLKRETPQYREVFQELKDFQSLVADFAQDAGLFSKAQRDAWMRNDYAFAFFREMGDSGRRRTGKGDAMGGASGIRGLRGSSRNLVDPMESLIAGPSKLVQLALENDARARMADTLTTKRGGGALMQRIPPGSKKVTVQTQQAMDAISRHLREMGVDPAELKDFRDLAKLEGMPEILALYAKDKPFGDNVMTVLENGKPRYFEVFDPLLVRSLEAVRRPQDTGVLRWVNAVRNLQQTAITITPDFMVANLTRDPVMASITTRSGIQHITAAASGLKSAITKDADYRAFLANGGGGAMIRNDPKVTRRQLARHARKTGFDPRALIVTPADVFRALDGLGRVVESSSRLGEFKRAKRQGASDEHAAYLGREVTTDFARRGDAPAAKFLSAAIPFFNAMVQGGDRLYRAGFKEGRGAQVGSKIGMVALYSIALAEMNREHQEYNDLPDWDRDAYWHYFIPDGNGGHVHLKQPKIWEVGAAATIAERAFDRGMSSSDKPLYEDAARIILSQFGVNPTGIASPLVESYANRVWFTGAPIETMGMKDLEPWRRTRASTPEALKKLGEVQHDLGVPPRLQVSPVKAEALLRGFFSTFASYGFMATDRLLNPDRESLHTDDLPVVRRLWERPGKYNRYTSEFYDLLEESTQASRTMKKLERDGEGRFDDYVGNRGVENYDMLRKTNLHARKINREIESVRASRDLTPDQKRDRIDALKSERTELFRDAVLEAQP